MLKPAQLYKEKLQEENIKAWYQPENMYWNVGTGDSQINIHDNNYDCHQFVSVDKDDNVIGYIVYSVDWAAMSANRFGIISFRKGSIEFAKDVYTAVCDLFEKYHMNRIQWFAFADNPAVRGYRNFIKRHGGRECAHYRQVAKLLDGQLHDSVCFEILAEEFKKVRVRKNEIPKQTNADRIRSMSDEELAEFLTHAETLGYNDSSVSGKLKMIEWLQSNAEERAWEYLKC